MIGTLAFNECCQRILVAEQANDYAKAYAKAGLQMTDREEIKTQALYILCNLRSWKGEEANLVRSQLRDFTRLK